MQVNDKFFFRLDDYQFTSVMEDGHPVSEGWLSTDDAVDRVMNADFWSYSQVPVPAVVLTLICNEAAATVPGAPALPVTLEHIAPHNGGHATYPTENSIGWTNNSSPPAHTSWRSTFAQLGFSATSIPADTQTQFNVSTSTLKWMSDRLSTIRDFKLNGKQLSLSSLVDLD